MSKDINHSLASFSLKRKRNISFALMSVLPLLVFTYVVSNYLVPRVGWKLDIAVSISISVFIAIIGFFLIKEVFDRILSVTSEAKLIAAGDVSRTLEAGELDEVGDLSEALNQLTQRIRDNMDELKNYSEKTTEINVEIQKRVIILSNLLQISSLITQGAKLEEILKLIIEKSRFLSNADTSYLFFREEGQEGFLMKEVDGSNSSNMLKINLEVNEPLFERAINTGKPLIIDKDNALTKNLVDGFYEKFKLKNTLALPVFLKRRVIGILGIGTEKESYSYKKDDIELLDIFSKQIAIAVENDLLMHRVEKLEIKDVLTGLYNKAFIQSRLQEEIKRAILYRRPCSFILFDIDNFRDLHQNLGLMASEAALKRIGSLIRDSVTEIDRVGRTGDDEFAVILPEKNKRQAQEVAEDIRKKIELIYSKEHDTNKKITVSAGVSENPLDGVDSQELIDAAKELVGLAKKQGKNRVGGFKELPK